MNRCFALFLHFLEADDLLRRRLEMRSDPAQNLTDFGQHGLIRGQVHLDGLLEDLDERDVTFEVGVNANCPVALDGIIQNLENFQGHQAAV